jgi:uncharacterized membrane protein
MLARAFGWASIALGATQLFAHRGGPGRKAGGALAVVAGLTALDVAGGRRVTSRYGRDYLARRKRAAQSPGVRVEEAATINRPIEDVYRAWKNFEGFPRFMRHLESVQMLGNGRSRWRATAPAGTTVEWEAEIVEEREGELIAWRSVEGSQIQNRGTVRFQRAPGERGTEVRVQLEYAPPAGRLGRGVAWLFGEEPDQQIRDDLRRFKQLMETGEITMSDGLSLWRPAQPARTADEVRTLAGVQR